MKFIKKFAVKLFWIISRILLPKKNYDPIYIYEFIKSKECKILNFQELIWSFRHGFLPYEYIWYELPKNDYRNYIPALNDFKKRTLIGNYSSILSNKILFEKHISSRIKGFPHLHVVESIGFIEHGSLFSLNKAVLPGKFSSLIPFLERTDLVLKPISGHKGEGVIFLKKNKNDYYLNNKLINWDELISVFENLKNYLIQEKFNQKGISNEIFPDSLNTIRVATMIDPVTQKAFIAYATHRFGSLKSGSLDNIVQGGIAALVDINSGKLSPGISFTNTGKKETYESHPQSNKPIFKEVIPNWSTLTKSFLEVIQSMPYLKYVGWDLIFSNEELYILEGNISPNLGLVQVFKPMTEFPPAWNFFKYYEYV